MSVSSTRIGTGAPSARLGSLGGLSPAQTGVAPSAAVQSTQPTGLAQIRYASTWPRGWMAAAVAQRVREFNAQISRAQVALLFLNTLAQSLEALETAIKHQQQLPSAGALQRLQQALQRLQQHWRQRHSLTLGSLDECLVWSATAKARKHFALAGWSWHSLQAQHSNDKELVSLCLMGQADAQAAWQAQDQRSDAATRYALAVALAALGIQLGRADAPLSLSVDERHWPTVQERFMLKGNGQRVPAGQWVAAPLQLNPQALPVQQWVANEQTDWHSLLDAVVGAHAQVAQAIADVSRFAQDAGQSLQPVDQQRLQEMQAFASAFSAAGQAPAYDWVLAVVPAVRAISRLRVRRLLRTQGVLG